MAGVSAIDFSQIKRNMYLLEALKNAKVKIIPILLDVAA
jgi:hypothetical protein